MTKIARILAAALLLAVLAVPASLQASSKPATRTAQRVTTPVRAASPSLFERLLHALGQVLPMAGPGLDPSGGS